MPCEAAVLRVHGKTVCRLTFLLLKVDLSSVAFVVVRQRSERVQAWSPFGVA